MQLGALTKSAKKRLAGSLLLALDLLLVGAAGEVWARFVIPVKSVCWTFDARLGPMFCPEQRRIGHVQEGYTSTFVTNSLGFHDIERERARRPGTRRIQVYGDSLIVAGGVRIEETIPSVAERALAESEGARVEVFNMAMLDGTTSAYLIYQELGAAFEPDIVVLNFMDDFPDNLSEVHRRPHHPHHRLDAAGRLVLVPPLERDLTRPWERLKRHSRLYRALANKLLESRFYYQARRAERELRFRLENFGKSGDASSVKSAVESPVEGAVESGRAEAERRRLLIEHGWPLTLEILAAFQERVERDGGRFVLSDGRRLYTRNVGTAYSNEDIERFCLERGIAYIPTYEAMDRLDAEPEQSRFFLSDHHPTPLGNEILGRFLAEGLAELIAEWEQTATRD